MKKLEHDGKVYRLPPDKNHPKGMRVRKDVIQHNDMFPTIGIRVCSVRDGHIFYTKEELVESR